MCGRWRSLFKISKGGDMNNETIFLGVCIDRVRSGLGYFLTQPTIVGQKNSTQPNPSHKSDPTQLTWVELNPWVGQIYYYYYYYY